MAARRSFLPISTATGGKSRPRNEDRIERNVTGRRFYAAPVTGELRIADAEKALLELLGIAARERQPCILVDCSRLQGEWNPDDRYAVGTFLAAQVERMASQFPQTPRIAVYAIAPLMDPNRYFQTVATTAARRCAPPIACRSSCHGSTLSH